MMTILILCFGLSVIVLLALGQVVIKKKNSVSFLLFFLLLVCTYWFGHAVAILLGLTQGFPHFIRTSLPFIALTCPLFYLYNLALFENYKISLKALKHGIPGVVSLLLALPFYLKPGDYKILYFESPPTGFAIYSLYLSERLTDIASIVYLVLTAMFLFKKYRNKLEDKGSVKNIQLMLTISILGLLAASSRSIGLLFGLSTYSLVIPSLLITLTVTLLYLFSMRQPEVIGLHFRKAKNVLEKSLYSEGEETEYRNIIQEKKFYLNPDLTLPELAHHLKIAPYELSRLVNGREKTNFTGFINHFRVEHAKKLLLGGDMLTIVEVCYQSGFNSKSAFYSHFRKVVGQTPTQFRKTMLPISLSHNAN